MTGRFLPIAAAAALAALVAPTTPANAEPNNPPDPRFPNIGIGHCPGAKGGGDGGWQFCDGVKYPDGSYWRESSYTGLAPEGLRPDQPTAPGRHCVVDLSGDHNGDPNGVKRAPYSACGRAAAR